MMNLKQQEEQMMSNAEGADVAAETSGVRSWTEELTAILEQAAALAVGHGDDPDGFMAAARGAYLNASPALREHIERLDMLAQMATLRRLGVLAEA